MLKTRLNMMLDIKHPIIQEGISHGTSSRLAEAVCRAGGLGVVASSSFSQKELEQQIDNMKTVQSPFGVSVDLDRDSAGDILETVINSQVPVVITMGENPAKHTKTLRERGIRVIHEIATLEQAKESEKAGADAVIVRGVESGGFINFHSLGSLIIVPAMADLVKIPIVAAGGVVDGRSMSAVLSMGAEGVQMGTRFLASSEAEIHEECKKALIKSTAADTVIIKYLGRPCRVLKTPAAEKIAETPAGDEEIRELFKKAALEGNIDDGLIQAGQGTGFIKSVKSAKDIIREILFEVMVVKDQFNKYVHVTRMFE